MKAKHIKISGKVQHVGFREFARKYASIHNIKGYVKNLLSGDLEILAQGEELNLTKFLNEIKRGPLTAHIRNVNVSETKLSEEYNGFVIEF